MKTLKPLSQNFRLRSVSIWNPDSVVECCDIEVEKGIVRSISPMAQGASSKWVCIPSGVDMQVHLRYPGQSLKETPETGLAAALFGGVGAVVTMPNTVPVIDTPKILLECKEALRPLCQRMGIDVYFTAAATRGQSGTEAVDFAGLADAGAVAFTDDGRGVASDQVMAKVFATLESLGLPFFQHSEVPGHGGILAASAAQRILGVKPYPKEPEFRMLERDLRLLQKYRRSRYHLLHASCSESVDLVRIAKANGLSVTMEVSPHHLWFASDEISPKDSSFKMNPPIRDKADRAALRNGMREGVVDWVATDHAPHEAAAKTLDFEKAAFGTLGLETSLPVLLALWTRGELQRQRLVQVFSTAPADYLKLGPGWGRIAVGAPFRSAIVDIQAKWIRWTAEDHHSLSKNSCFVGTELPHAPMAHATNAGFFQLFDCDLPVEIL